MSKALSLRNTACPSPGGDAVVMFTLTFNNLPLDSFIHSFIQYRDLCSAS